MLPSLYLTESAPISERTKRGRQDQDRTQKKVDIIQHARQRGARHSRPRETMALLPRRCIGDGKRGRAQSPRPSSFTPTATASLEENGPRSIYVSARGLSNKRDEPRNPAVELFTQRI